MPDEPLSLCLRIAPGGWCIIDIQASAERGDLRRLLNVFNDSTLIFSDVGFVGGSREALWAVRLSSAPTNPRTHFPYIPYIPCAPGIHCLAPLSPAASTGARAVAVRINRKGRRGCSRAGRGDGRLQRRRDLLGHGLVLDVHALFISTEPRGNGYGPRALAPALLPRSPARRRRLTRHRATQVWGGAVYVNWGASLTCVACSFEDNHAVITHSQPDISRPPVPRHSLLVP